LNIQTTFVYTHYKLLRVRSVIKQTTWITSRLTSLKISELVEAYEGQKTWTCGRVWWSTTTRLDRERVNGKGLRMECLSSGLIKHSKSLEYRVDVVIFLQWEWVSSFLTAHQHN